MSRDDLLRDAWEDERQHLLEDIRRQLVVLQRPGASDEQRRAAVLDVRRAVHTLKGAARVVGERRDEALAHRLEGQLPQLEAPIDLEEAGRRIQDFLRAMGAPTGASEQEARPDAPADAQGEEAPAPYGEAASDVGTVRTSARHLAHIAAVAEDLSVLTASGLHGIPTREEIDRQLAPLRDALQRLDERARVEPTARPAFERFASWLSGVVGQQRKRIRAIRERAEALEGTSRALRAVRFDTVGALLESTTLEVARELGKEVRFQLVGGAAELDRRVVEKLVDPLVHLVRNAVDHGIERPDERLAAGKPREGLVTVSVRARGADLLVEVQDDGGGVQLDQVAARARERGRGSPDEGALEWLFEPGFTTRERPTAISGRGLGLDVVRSRVTALHGRVQLETTPGHGTRIRIRVPADLSVARGWVVRVGERRHVVLESSVERAFQLSTAERRLVGAHQYVVLEGALWPLIDAAVLLDGGAEPRELVGLPVLALAVGDRRLALSIDELSDASDYVIKPLGERVRRGGFVLGAVVLKDGQLACVLDVSAIARHAAVATWTEPHRAEGVPRILVVDDSLTTRQLMVSILSTAGYVVEAAVDGQDAWERILREAPDLVVSDLEMPRVDGFRLLTRIKSSPQTASLPVVLVTARSNEEDRRRALELGADGYVVKGRFDQGELLDVLSELLP